MENIVEGGCDPTPPSSSGGGGLSGALGAVGGLAQAALSGDLAGALKGMAVEQGKTLATAALMKVFTVTADPKPAKPPWAGMGQIAPPGSAVAAAATAAYSSVHTAPPAPAAGAPAGGGAGAGTGGGGAAGTGTGSTGGSVGSDSQGQTPKMEPRDMWTNITLNDLFHVALAGVMMPAALALRALAELFPESMESFFNWLPKSWAGTGDKSGFIGFLFGNNDHKGMGGVIGVANSLGHKLLDWLGLSYEEFEEGQRAHDFKTGRDPITGEDQPSNGYKSFKQAMGQFFGELAYRMGMGREFYRLVEELLGPPDWYGFVSGVWQGTKQESYPRKR